MFKIIKIMMDLLPSLRPCSCFFSLITLITLLAFNSNSRRGGILPTLVHAEGQEDQYYSEFEDGQPKCVNQEVSAQWRKDQQAKCAMHPQ
jgi:hypothetical protein